MWVCPYFYSAMLPATKTDLPSAEHQAFSHPPRLGQVTAEDAGSLKGWSMSFLFISMSAGPSSTRHSIWLGASPQ